VAFDAKSHPETNPLDSIHGLHRPVTFLTFNLFLDMSLVVKQDMLRNIVDFYPGRWRLGVIIAVLFFYPRMIGDDIRVAVETLLYRGYAGKRGAIDIGMAVLALDRLYPGMHAMTERDGLLGSDVRCRRRIEKEQECQHQNESKGNEQKEAPVVSKKSY
jgi:hypothetical protein